MSGLPAAVAALAAAMGGFLALSLAMDRHYEDIHGRGQTPGRRAPWLRAAGVAGLLLSLAACQALRGATQGTVLWCGVLTAGALATALLLSYAPRQVGRLLWVTGVAAVSMLPVVLFG